jgi:DNA-binding NtrC family response regulator
MRNKANILIVDDEEVVRLSHLRSLAGANYNAEVARDGLEALHIMEQRQFDVVFLDLRMPELDGITVLRKIRNKWPECEVVIITGYPTIETAKEAVKLGAYHYLVKPVGPVDVVKAADEALNHKHWALRPEGPARQSVQNLNSRLWLDELPAHIASTLIARQGGTS